MILKAIGDKSSVLRESDGQIQHRLGCVYLYSCWINSLRTQSDQLTASNDLITVVLQVFIRILLF